MIDSVRYSFGLVAILSIASLATAQPADDNRALSAGIRKIESRHLTLYTDLPPNFEIDQLPRAFDQAVPQWAAYFEINPAKTANWRAQAYLIGQRRRFDALGLMPAGNDQFVNGISVGSKFWLYDQPTAYYRRHLLLHEGTHAFMSSFLGGCGPGWYMEGTAELLATHRLDGQTGRLTLGVMPIDRGEVPMLGRIKLVHDAFAANRALSFPDVVLIDNRKQLDNESYAWTWAAAKWLDAHPRYQLRFRQLYKHVLSPNFNEILRRTYADDWPQLLAEWRAFVATLDYGYDFERMAIEFERGQPLNNGSKRTTIAADHGWQSSGAWLEAGKTYRITASGRYQIAAEEINGAKQAWPCEPGGVTIEYYAGQPLGILLGVVMGEARSEERGASVGANADGFVKPFVIGLGCELAPPASGTLYLRVNDSAGQLGDNRGTLTTTIVEAKTSGATN